MNHIEQLLRRLKAEPAENENVFCRSEASRTRLFRLMQLLPAGVNCAIARRSLGIE
jgi:hypothetical protein